MAFQFLIPTAVVSLIAGFAQGQTTSRMQSAPQFTSGDPTPALQRQREAPNMPYMAGTGRSAPCSHVQFGPYVSVQVNVDAHGNNIVGDAANEPSLVVDPANPNRMAIGFRQFDTIESDFRQGGYAYSTDAGRHWTFPGVLEPGVFRTDPVLAASPDGVFYYNSLRYPDFLCDVYRSADAGRTWPAGVYAYGGDKAWMTVDHTSGMGRGNIYCAWSPYYGCCGDQIFSRSTDGGATWLPPIDIPNYYTAFGTLAVGPEGELYVAGGWSSFIVAKSLNAQNPATMPTFVTAFVDLGGDQTGWEGPNPGGLLGQAWVACDTSNGPTRGNVYLLCSATNYGQNDPLDVVISRSIDGGLTWSDPIRVNDDLGTSNSWQWFGTMSVAPNGRIDVIWNDTRHSPQNFFISELYYSSSSDGGLTWTPNVQLSPSWNSSVGWPQQNKIGDYYHMISDNVGANLAYSATFNGEQDVWFLRIGDYDCNGNGIGDAQDIADHTVTDLNRNGIPDTCEDWKSAIPDD